MDLDCPHLDVSISCLTIHTYYLPIVYMTVHLKLLAGFDFCDRNCLA